MAKWLRRTVLGVVVIGVVGAAAVATGLVLGDKRLERRYELKVAPITLRDDAAAVERGRYLYASRGCVDCHGTDGAGATLVDNGQGLKLAGPNITTGNPKIKSYRPEDWVRSIRHGLATDGRALRLMPSEDYARWTDEDLASVVAYVRQLPAKDGQLQAIIELPLPARVMYGFGGIPEAYHKIDHSLPPARPVPEGVTVEHGAYVAQMCQGCHGPKLLGGRIPGAPPDWPAASRLVPGDGNRMDAYRDPATFISMMRTGKRPDGSAIAVMPFPSLKEMNDTDLQALHRYLTQLKAP